MFIYIDASLRVEAQTTRLGRIKQAAPPALRFHYALTKDRVCIVDHMLHW